MKPTNNFKNILQHNSGKTVSTSSSSFTTLSLPSSSSFNSLTSSALTTTKQLSSCHSPTHISHHHGTHDDATQWKTVTKGFKPKKAKATSNNFSNKNTNSKSATTSLTKVAAKGGGVVPNKQPKTLSQVLAENKYHVPKKLESGLHHNSAISTLFAPKSKSGSASTSSNSLRCHKRNQRRNRKRAALRAQREKEENETHTTAAATPVTVITMGKTITTMEDDLTIPTPTIPIHMEDIWTDGILSFLSPKDVLSFGSCSKTTKQLSESGHIWRPFYHTQFPEFLSHTNTNPLTMSSTEWKLMFKLSTTGVLERLRCSRTKQTFFQDVLGVGIDYTINPKTKKVDYIMTSQDLFSASAFQNQNGGIQKNTTMDVFGNKFQLFLPLYFSPNHFERALPMIQKTIVRLCPEWNCTTFDPYMALDVLPKIVNTFVVLVCDEGLAASRKSFHGIMRIHRLFLALVTKYPMIRDEALLRLRNFVRSEECRVKSACPSLGHLLPLLMVVDQASFQWAYMSSAYLYESLDRGVLWACKTYPELEVLTDSSPEKRLKLTREANQVSMRLNMMSAYFQWLFCKGSTSHRAWLYDEYCGRLEADENLLGNMGSQEKEVVNVEGEIKSVVSTISSSHLTFQKFRYQIHRILSVKSWQEYFKFLLIPCPQSKEKMAKLLKNAVKNSARKKYHKKGMDFSRVHSSGTSKILAKGQQYSAKKTLRHVEFQDHWTFDDTMFLDATCILYAGKSMVSTVDYCHTSYRQEAVVHSGDVMSENSGSHTINLDLDAIDQKVTSCVFVLSAFCEATLVDVKSASIAFRDADSDAYSEPLCTYHLESHNKVPHLKSIIMCKLYRKKTSDDWHVLAIGDSHAGSADNYGPIYDAVQKLL